MKKIFVLGCMLAGAFTVSAQQSSLLEKYRNMALEYNHDLKAAEKNISVSMELEKSARADLKPKVEAGGNFQYTGNPMELSVDVPSLGRSVGFKATALYRGMGA